MTTKPNQEWVEVAAAIAGRLCRDAIWSGERCGWIGYSMEPVSGMWRGVHQAVGPDMYNGTSGIALFLATAWKFTKEPIFAETAMGALAQAFSLGNKLDDISSLGWHGGRTGISLCGLQVASLFESEKGSGGLQVDRWREASFKLLKSTAEISEEKAASIDILSGISGVVLGLVRAHTRYGAPAWTIDAAARWGQRLLNVATKSDRGLSWPAMVGEASSKGDLCGFSHGVSGTALALAELAKATNDKKFKQAALDALRYERACFSKKHQNWPDFRDPKETGMPEPPEWPTYMTAWCHGSPGIVLSRLQIAKLLDDPAILEDAKAGLPSVIDSIATSPNLDSGHGMCLCHGHGGNAEAIIEASRTLSDPSLMQHVHRVAQWGFEHCHKQHAAWPCGTNGGKETPSLMIGTAGIGYFYLRVASPDTVVSVLV